MDFPIPENEPGRLQAIEQYEIIGSEPEQAFDDLAELAALVCDCPIGYVNFVTENHRWIKACYGLPVALAEAPRGSTSCQWTVCQSDVVVVPDLTQDVRFRELPYVVGPPYIRFYAGGPLINPEGYALGTICVGDFEPRQLRPEQADALRRLARQTIGQLELRRQVIALRQAEHAINEQKERAAENVEPRALIDDLDRYFCAFDDIASRHGLETLKTIGDAYMAVGGLPGGSRTHPVDACLTGLAIQEYVTRMNAQRQKLRLPPWELRVGIHTGGVMAGIVGRRKFTYDVWGDAVNVAARMEATCDPGRVNVSEQTWQHVRHQFEAEPRGTIEAKHKGRLQMFFLKKS